VVAFKDEDYVRLIQATSNMHTLIASLRDLKIYGGGRCPEASDLGLLKGNKHLKPGGLMVLLTDAKARAAADFAKVNEELAKNQAQAYYIRVQMDCYDEDSSFDFKEHSELEAD
jgi:hypothetical protein